MPTDLPGSRATNKRRPRTPKYAETDWTVASASIPALLLLLMLTLPSALVLPAFAIVTVSIGLVLGTMSYMNQMRTYNRSQQSRDAAGVLLLIGFGASMFTDVGGALATLSEIESQYRTAAANDA